MNISNPSSISDGELTNAKFAPAALAAVNFASDVSFTSRFPGGLFTSSGTVTYPKTGAYIVIIQQAGGGGASGRPNSGGTYAYLPGQPGGGGSLSMCEVTRVAGVTETVTIGSPGNPGVYDSVSGLAVSGGNATPTRTYNIPNDIVGVGGVANNVLLSNNILGCNGLFAQGGGVGLPGAIGADINTLTIAISTTGNTGAGGCSGATVVTSTSTNFDGAYGTRGYILFLSI